ncbi:MAG: ATP-binding protein [Albidovulum sp.]|nr:ATP-binding protein [Albidovulum sp.]
MRYVDNPPDAGSLMTSARSFGNYDLAAALADLVDNSIHAKAQNIEIRCLFNDGHPVVRVIDDGCGMSADTLRKAMRPASTNPTDQRSPDDLGRFGWGMKSASFSQCTRLTVMSRHAGDASGAVWDLNDIDCWKMGILSEDDMAEAMSHELLKGDGTEILWQNCDRLSESGNISTSSFNELIAHSGDRLALIFHKYLSGEARRQRLTISLNGSVLEPFDPFFRHHNATMPMQVEPLSINDEIVEIAPYILPHFSKLRLSDHDRLGGEGGFLRTQGFYIYRNHRLIIDGTWFRLAKFGELSQLVRIGVNIPNALDDMWKITIDKSDAQLPAALRHRLKQIVAGLKRNSSKVFRSKGGRIDRPGTVPVWNRHSRHGEIQYRINRDHPIIARLFKTDDRTARKSVLAALKTIEQTFPVAAFGSDATEDLNSIHQTETDPLRVREWLEAVIPGLLLDAGGDINKMADTLRKTEPFSVNWNIVEEYLKEKGWISE